METKSISSETTKSIKWLSACFFLITAFLFFAVAPVKVKAANYEAVDLRLIIEEDDEDGVVQLSDKVKVGNYYYWGEDAGAELQTFQIFVSKSSKSRKGVLIAEVSWDESDFRLLTNGSTIYYKTKKNNKVTFYSMRVNGKNRKKIATISGSGDSVDLIKVYGNYIYYTKTDNKGTFLYSLSLKTGKSKKRVEANYSSFGGLGEVKTRSDSAYIYVLKRTNTKHTVKIFDCKKMKTIKTLSIKKSSSDYWTNAWVTNKYLYYGIETGDSLKVYRALNNGSKAFKLLATIKYDKDHDVNFGTVNDTYVYYYYLDDGAYKCYRYRIKDKSVKKISATAFYKIMGWIVRTK